MPNFFRKKSLSLATAIAGVLTFGSMMGCSDTDNDDPGSLGSGSPTVSGIIGGEGGNEVTFVGRYNSDVSPKFEMYRGIHYGESTAGENRFEPPVPKVLSGRVDATSAGPLCPQEGSAYGARSENEDCLVLNVYKPIPSEANGLDTEESEPYPVMVWIHGGAFIYGSGTEKDYNPQDLVDKGVIVVTLNYRLGALGFLSHADGIEGNFGLMDQQLAMNWVHQNIGVFNGDPNNITLFGESAGGHSVLSHLVAPESEELFDKAIVQSGSYMGFQFDVDTAEGLGAAFAADPNVNCSDAECLRDLPVSTILDNQGETYALVLPTAGTDFLPYPINYALPANTKPVILGSNVNEGALFSYLDLLSKTGAYPNDHVTNTMYKEAVNKLLGTYVVDGNGDGIPSILSLDTDAIAAMQTTGAGRIFWYLTGGHLGNPSAVTDPDVWDAAADLMDDPTVNTASLRKLGSLAYGQAYKNIYTQSFFACPANYQVERLVSDAGTDVYAYQFSDRQSPQQLRDIVIASNPLESGAPFMGATHATEIQYLFGNAVIRGEAARGSGAKFIPTQHTLANNMISYWTNFAKTGNPNGGSLPVWGEYDETSVVLNLDDGVGGITASSGAAFRAQHYCALWNDTSGFGLPQAED